MSLLNHALVIGIEIESVIEIEKESENGKEKEISDGLRSALQVEKKEVIEDVVVVIETTNHQEIVLLCLGSIVIGQEKGQIDNAQHLGTAMNGLEKERDQMTSKYCSFNCDFSVFYFSILCMSKHLVRTQVKLKVKFQATNIAFAALNQFCCFKLFARKRKILFVLLWPMNASQFS